ncbi:MAG: response regulator transcription factor [Candidatus Eremiobacteraeota bacterium]|nr:response regulator transcription factor [Candidatus Eremiobacteraeota bacterium]
MSGRILIIDDDPNVVALLGVVLDREGFEVRSARNLRKAREAIAQCGFDLLVLDLNLPDGNGLDLLKLLPQPRTPTILLTARGEETDRIVGMEFGADDYVVKPFSPREMLLRIRAVLRRSAGAAPSGGARRLKVRDLEIDEAAHLVRVGSRSIALTPTEFRLLSILVEHAGRVLSRTQLLDILGENDRGILERTLDRHVNNLRKKIERDATAPEYVETVYGVGYTVRKSA